MWAAEGRPHYRVRGHCVSATGCPICKNCSSSLRVPLCTMHALVVVRSRLSHERTAGGDGGKLQIALVSRVPFCLPGASSSYWAAKLPKVLISTARYVTAAAPHSGRLHISRSRMFTFPRWCPPEGRIYRLPPSVTQEVLGVRYLWHGEQFSSHIDVKRPKHR